MVQPFEFALLLQLCVMISIHCLLLNTSLKYRSQADINPEFLKEYPSFEVGLGNKWFSNENLYAAPSSRSRLLLLIGSSSSSDQGSRYLYSLSLVFSLEVPILDRIVKNFIHVVNFLKLLIKQVLYFFDGQYRRPFDFWQWAEARSYWKFLLRFVLGFGILTAIFRNNIAFGNILGFMGLFIESLLPLPQILLLNRLQSVKNFKVVLLLSWLGGDCTKISYLIFGTDNATAIFMFAALFQMSLDILVAYQFLTYKKLEGLELGINGKV